jgi:hypothetical protein
VTVAAPDRKTRRLLIDVQRRAARVTRDELSEHIRKQGAKASDAPAGPEADAWQRAL